MALIMNEEQRQKTLEEYNPKEHLIPVDKDKQGKQTMYYPAAWRLYELHLRYPNANFKSEIIYHDAQKGTLIVKAYLYLGKNYEESDKKAESMKQGSLATLDKVETAAKARCARDFGIGTEYALDMTPDETDATHDAPIDRTQSSDNGRKSIPVSHQDGQQTGQDVKRSKHTQHQETVQETHPGGSNTVLQRMIEQAKARATKLGIVWDRVKAESLGEQIPDEKLITTQFTKINGYLAKKERGEAA